MNSKTNESGNGVGTRITDEPVLTENGRKVLEARYLKKNEAGQCVETPGALFRRVARTVAEIEILYGGTELVRRRWEERFYKLMTSGAFMPNSPTLMNAGREMGMLSACFVLPVRDSIVDIFNSIKHTALIQKAGGGTGFAFDELRPTGDFIASSGGTTSGPISFWKAFSEATNAIQQGAFRRGANMGMMYIHHPDILKFLHAKQDLQQFTNYNISVKVTDDWMHEFLADADSPHIVRNPRTGKAYVLPRELEIWKYTLRDLVEVTCVEEVPATAREKYFRTPRMNAELPEELRGRVYTKGEIWRIIVENAWQTGEPGVVFMDRINEQNPTPHVGRIEATNPCGEQPLLPYEACNLGSVNLGLFVQDPCTEQARVDWDGLREAVHVSTRFLDNVIDANNYPLPEIEQICLANRKIGLGVMGFADALFKLNVPYDSEEGVEWGARFMKFLNDEGHQASEQLARERGCFPNWQGSVWHQQNRIMRNAAVTTVAPTGTISIIANCAGGIEPLFSLAFIRNVLKGQRPGDKPLIEVNDTFLNVARERGFHSEELVERVAREGTLAHVEEAPEDVKRVFVCAHDITPEWHMRMQAAFQRHCDASISKTINFPHAATQADVEQIYRLAFELGCKGVTVYRDGCRSEQPMALKQEEAPRTPPAKRADDPPPAPPAPEWPRVINGYIEPMDLCEIVSGLRIRQMTPFGNMHVKITVDPRHDRELEIFAQLGKGGDVANSDLEGLCRIASLWLRAGGSLKALVKQWDGIGSSMQIPTRVGRIMSLPDGLACALKKYMKAKERFGLKALLLGEIDLSELDHPNPPPHHPETTPMDRPAPAARVQAGGNGGNAGNGGNGGSRVETTVVRPVARAAPVSGRISPPKAQHVGNGNGKGHGHGASEDGASEVGVATLSEAEEAEETVAAVEARMTPALPASPATVAATVPMSAAVEHVHVLASTELSAVMSEVQHQHDAAAMYKLICPSCGSTLVRQEGCKRCPSCHWSAC